MNVSLFNKNEILTTSRRAFNGSQGVTEHKRYSFTQNIVNKGKANIEELKKDDDKRYSVLGAIGAVGVLIGLGFALANREAVTKFFKKKKAYIKPTMTERKLRSVPHGGPEVDFSKGKTAIADAWNEYIKGIADRRKQNNKIAKEYKEFFKINAKKVEELEKIARKRSEYPSKYWA